MVGSQFLAYITLTAVLIGSSTAQLARAGRPAVSFSKQPGQLNIAIGGQPFATYHYQDKVTTRPYFKHVHAPGGIQATRTFPPVEGKDAMDHPTFHPGIWMAFGDITGHDYWRLKARIAHDGFVGKPQGGTGQGAFTVKNRYLTEDRTGTVCTETCRFHILVRPLSYLLVWDSTFQSATGEINFGDQEEMGVAFRIVTPASVVEKGHIIDSQGRRDEKQIWGKRAEWCDYSGPVAGHHVGITVVPDPTITGRCWWHARDSGFMCSNPFGCTSFGGEKRKMIVPKGESFRLRYGLVIHSSPNASEYDVQAAVKDCLLQLRKLVE